MSGYPTIRRLSEPNPTILRASESNFLESNTIWPFTYPTFSEFGAKFGKKGGDIWLNIRLFDYSTNTNTTIKQKYNFFRYT